jgi:hypothetical protein
MIHNVHLFLLLIVSRGNFSKGQHDDEFALQNPIELMVLSKKIIKLSQAGPASPSSIGRIGEMRDFTPQQVRDFTPQQVRDFTPQQVRDFTPQQVRDFILSKKNN